MPGSNVKSAGGNGAPRKTVKKTTDKSKDKFQKKSDKERRERDSCVSRVANEYKLFTKLNQNDQLSIINKMYEPTKVVLDTLYDRSSNQAPIKKADKTTAKDGSKPQTKQQEEKSVLTNENNSNVFTLDKLQAGKPRLFEQLPISSRTKKGLEDAGYRVLTKIQHATISHTLARRDLMAVSCTGSGKSLAFIIPLLESLWQQNWNYSLGLGAIIITPTRELALQTFHTIRRIGKYHEFSAGMLIGGTSFEEERKSIGGMNILVCTPGRLMHHLEQSYSLDVSNVITVVLDEADHLLDLGFMDQLDALLPILPKPQEFKPDTITQNLVRPGRHTMLFSATSNRQVEALTSKVLATTPYKIALTNTQSVQHPGVAKAGPTADGGNPKSLRHNYCILPEIKKIDALFSFLRLHNSNKVLVFVATTRQATFLYETFRIFSVGMPVLRLHSKLSPTNRIQIYNEFQKHKNGVMFCTDIASRGLDITNVSWVVHLDCPESVDQYIHRSGRTARMNTKGQNLLMLTPSQEKFISLLQIHPNSADQIKLHKVTDPPPIRKELHQHFQTLFGQKPLFKSHAEKALISYIQHILYNHNKYNDMSSDDESESSDDNSNDDDKKRTNYTFQKEAKIWENVFDPAQYDMYGLSYAHGLTAVPMIDMGGGDSSSDDEEEQQQQQQKAQQQKQASKKSTSSKDDDADEIDDTQVTHRTNQLIAQYNQKLKKLAKLEKQSQLVEMDDSDNEGFVPILPKKSMDEQEKVQQQQNPWDVNNIDDAEFTLCTFKDLNDELSEDSSSADNNEQEDRLALLKRRYEQLDKQDKQSTKELAAKKRKYVQNMKKLAKLKQQGINMTLEELEQMIQQGKLSDINKQVHNGQFYEDSEDDADVEGSDNDDEENEYMQSIKKTSTMSDNDDSDAEYGDDEDDSDSLVGFAAGGDESDDSDELNEFQKWELEEKQKEQVVAASKGKQQQQQQQPKPTAATAGMLLNETSEDESESDAPLPVKSTLAQQAKKANEKQQQQHQPQQQQTKKLGQLSKYQQLNRMLNESSSDSDSDSDDYAKKPILRNLNSAANKPAPKKLLNLDESSSDSDSDNLPVFKTKAKATPVIQESTQKKRLNLDETSDDDDSDDDIVAYSKKQQQQQEQQKTNAMGDDSDDDSDAPAVTTTLAVASQKKSTTVPIKKTVAPTTAKKTVATTTAKKTFATTASTTKKVVPTAKKSIAAPKRK